MLPVPKPESIVVRTSTKEEHNSKNDEANDCDELNRGEPKLRFTIPRNDEDVQNNAYYG